MGCDIHMCVEQKVGDKWVSCDKTKRDNDGYLSIPNPIYHDRDYTVFAVLAGVRGWLESDQKYPTKGFPKDASPETKELYENYGSDAHSTSYLTVKELNDVCWATAYIIRVFDLTERQFDIYKFAIEKHCEKNGVFKQGAYVLKNSPYLVPWYLYPLLKTPWYSMMEMVYKDFPYKCGDTKEVPLAVPLELICPSFYHKVINNLYRYAGGNTSENGVRIVFWFDN